MKVKPFKKVFINNYSIGIKNDMPFLLEDVLISFNGRFVYIQDIFVLVLMIQN